MIRRPNVPCQNVETDRTKTIRVQVLKAAELPSQADKNRRSVGPAARRLGRRELHARGTSAAVRSCHGVLVAAAGVPLTAARV